MSSRRCRSPGDWSRACQRDRDAGHRSTRAGAPATGQRPPGQCGGGGALLNVGRGRSPGDCSAISAAFAGSYRRAQRGPGPEPRRLHAAAPSIGSRSPSAQRGPGPEPRRLGPAPTPGSGRPPPLNVGRGRSPGDCEALVVLGVGGPRRSTWAGAGAPATDLRHRLPRPRVRRSTWAGAGAPATERHRRAIRRELHPRSTWAGAGAPATVSASVSPSTTSTGAQRGPGPEPRRLPRSIAPVSRSVISAQRGPGPEPRRLSSSQVCSIGWGCAQRGPGPEPRRLRRARSRSPIPGSSAQRGPGPEPRRLRDGPGLVGRVARSRSTWAGAGAPATGTASRT